MRKQKTLGNKGFSLVELIIVIAIMAILVGVLAPQLLRYVERTRVSADTQLADSVRTAISTAMMDPAVINAPNNGIPATLPATLTMALANYQASGADTPFGAAVATTLGYANATAMCNAVAGSGGVVDRLQSAGANGLTIAIDANNRVAVTVDNSNDGNGNNIVVQ